MSLSSHIDAIVSAIAAAIASIVAMRWKGKRADAAYLEVVMRGAQAQIDSLSKQVCRLEERIEQLNSALDASELRVISAEMSKMAAMRGSLSLGGMPVPAVVVRVDQHGRATEMVYFNEPYAKLFGVTRDHLYTDIDEAHAHVQWGDDDEWLIRDAYREGREQIGTVDFSMDGRTYRYVVLAWPIRLNGETSMVGLLGLPLKAENDGRDQ